MAVTPHVALTLVESAQAQKEVTVNTALLRLDALLNTGAVTRTLGAPPGSAAAGDVYIVGASPSGDWTGHAGHVAYFDQLWRFIVPREGITLWVNDENLLLAFDGVNWIDAVRGGKQTLFVPAGQMRPSASGGCAGLAQVATGSGQPDIVSLDFDAATPEYAQFSIAMPTSWDEGSITAQLLWSHASAATNFGVVWTLQALAVSDGDALGAAFGGAVSVSDTGGMANAQYISAVSASVAPGGSPAEGNALYFRIGRDAGHANDTLAVDARLHGVRLFYTTNALHDN